MILESKRYNIHNLSGSTAVENLVLTANEAPYGWRDNMWGEHGDILGKAKISQDSGQYPKTKKSLGYLKEIGSKTGKEDAFF